MFYINLATINIILTQGDYVLENIQLIINQN